MSGPFLSHRPRRPGQPRPRSRGLVGLVALALVAAAVGAAWLSVRGAVPARTSVGGVQVGGLSVEDARARLVKEGQSRASQPISLVGPDGTAVTSGLALGAEPLVDRALATALESSGATRLLRRVGIGGDRKFPLTFRLGLVRVANVVDGLDARFAHPPRNGDVAIDGLDVRVVASAAGTTIDHGAFRRAAASLPTKVTLVIRDAVPLVSTAQAGAAAVRIRRLLDGPRAVRAGDLEAWLWPLQVAALLRTVPSAKGLRVELDPEGLVDALRPRLRALETPAQNASFASVGEDVEVVPARDGTVLDGERIGASLVGNLAATVHLARFAPAAPALTTAAAEALGIEDVIAEFRTEHPCCANRVMNIHRGADVIDGTVVLPGEEFSLNEVLGERTSKRGFVSAPQILAGRLEDAIGGGVSQIATTLFNAAFFAGVEIVTHQPHEFYISRYPMGREATVSWGGPELIWRNDWDAPIVVTMAYTDTSLTVRLFSRMLGRRVETETGAACCSVAPTVIRVKNPLLAPGKQEQVQEAGPWGFSIAYTRRVFQDGKLRSDERFSWRYKAENAIVEVGPPRKKKGQGEAKPGTSLPTEPAVVAPSDPAR